MRSAVCTIVAKNYLAHARVLMASVRDWMPEARRVVVLVDQVEGCFDPSHEEFDVILTSDLHLPNSAWFHFKYTVLELSTAVKPYALEFLLHRYQLDCLVFLDPDIRLYSNLEEMWALLSQNSIVLTPHLTAQIDDGALPGELDILRSGTYNLGFIAVASTPVTHEFLQWWQAKLYDNCVVDMARGLFVDQRWIDLVPGMFDGVAILRHSGYNVAYWNLKTRAFRCDNGVCSVNGVPLRFFHFSGFDPEKPTVLSKYQDRLELAALGEVEALFNGYAGALLQAGYSDCHRWPYAYGTFRNGVPIPDIGRSFHHEVPGVEGRISDPFSDEGFHTFLETWNEPLIGPNGERTGITRLGYRVYRTRADVQSVMPDVFGGDYRRFLEWLLASGKSEHELDRVFLAPAWDAFQAAERHAGHNVAASALMEPTSELAGLLREHAVSEAALNELVEPGRGGPRLTRLARIIYESRPDLQRYHPDPEGRDGVKFLAWMLTYGRSEYALSDSLLAPLREQWQQVLKSLPSPLHRWWYDVLFLGMDRSAKMHARRRSSSRK